MGTDVYEREPVQADAADSSTRRRGCTPVEIEREAVEAVQDVRAMEREPVGPEESKGVVRKRLPLSSRFVTAGRLHGLLNHMVLQWSMRSNLGYRLGLLLKLPLGFRCGIRVLKDSEADLALLLPFRRFNRNWYGAMAGASLLGNVEIAAGTHLLRQYGSRAIIICKDVSYQFLRPCFTDAVYYVHQERDAGPPEAGAGEFNVTLRVTVAEWPPGPGTKKRRLGRCLISFHVILRDASPKRSGRPASSGRPSDDRPPAGGMDPDGGESQ